MLIHISTHTLSPILQYYYSCVGGHFMYKTYHLFENIPFYFNVQLSQSIYSTDCPKYTPDCRYFLLSCSISLLPHLLMVIGPHILLCIGQVLETISQIRVRRHTRLSISIGSTDATINRRYLSRYRGDVLAYAHRDRFGPLHILSCCYYY